ncbi:MAG: hypothetical protein WBA00_20840 [Rhodococcus sp. (in: high G+C Gram-positive bacteria)]
MSVRGGRTLSEVLSDLSGVVRRIDSSTVRDAEATGSVSLTVGNIALYRFFGIHLAAGRRQMPMRIRLQRSKNGIYATVEFRDPWALLRIEKERRVFAERVDLLRSLMSG